MQNYFSLTKKRFYLLAAGFLVLFALRLIYGLTAEPYPATFPAATHTFFPGQNRQQATEGQIQQQQQARKNYAYDKFDNIVAGIKVTISQLYEKIGRLSLKSAQFEPDEQKIRTCIADNNILIQLEQSYGLKGQRSLNMSLGVIPDKFDIVISTFKQIGVIQSIQIEKSDKTNEFKELQAKKDSLEKNRQALEQIKTKGGSIKEYIDLETRILETENQIQSFGVRLGEFDEENSFCTVQLYLYESLPETISIPSFLLLAFQWTVLYNFLLLLILVTGSLAILLILNIIQKANPPANHQNL